MFSSTVIDHWKTSEAPAADEIRVVVDGSLPHDRRAQVLEVAGAGAIVTLAPDVAAAAGLTAGEPLDRAHLAEALARAGIVLNGADAVFYFASDAQRSLRAEVAQADVRRLTDEDAAVFAAFAAAAPEDDLDEAFVELDHWLVFGAFADGELVAAASMYPWTGTTLADLGVITLPEHRGRGLARAVVRALSAEALTLGYEPQYRCQLDNTASLALAASAGLTRFATWDVVAQEQ